MEIVARYKGSDGKTVGYKVRYEGKEVFLSDEQIRVLAGMITNAVPLENGEFRAKAGCHIDTLIDKKSVKKEIAIQKNRPEISIKSKEDTGELMKADGIEFINICRFIRKQAISGNIRVEERQHKSNKGANIHLFKLIKACGLSVKEFVSAYLSVIQPCFLEKYKDNTKELICVNDTCYMVKLLIKIDRSKKNSLVVSFQDNNSLIYNKISSAKDGNSDCMVIADSISPLYNDKCTVIYRVQRGFLQLKLKEVTNRYNKDIAIVKYHSIADAFEDAIRMGIANAEQYCNDDNKVASLYKGECLSSMSYGATDVNIICLLIDLFTYRGAGDYANRRAISSLAGELVSSMTQDRQLELKGALEDRFKIADKEYENELLSYINGVF